MRRTVTLVAAAALLIAIALAAATVGGLFERRPVVAPPLLSASPSALRLAVGRAVGVAEPGREPRRRRPSGSICPTTSAGTAFVEITDLSGTMTAARAGQPSEGGEITGDIGVANLAGDPASVVLSWAGCPSDTRHVLTIAADGRTMTLDQPVCTGDTLGIERVLVLTFSGPVPAGEVHATVNRIGG